jgi:HTH-type transcriptional regulator/antitoxin HigA
LNNAGVVFFVLPHLQKTYLDGAAFFVDHTPVIVYTGRYKRIDIFWFTVAH